MFQAKIYFGNALGTVATVENLTSHEVNEVWKVFKVRGSFWFSFSGGSGKMVNMSEVILIDISEM